MNDREQYVELNARSAFSFLQAASVPEDLAGMCAELGMSGLALVDRDGVYGAPRFHLAARKKGVRAHIGTALTLAVPSSLAPRTPHLAPSALATSVELPVLAEDRAGYQNICRLVTRMKMRAKKGEGAALWDEIGEFSRGLVCLTGGERGPLAHALQTGGIDEAMRAGEGLVRAFGAGNVYAELQRHFDRDEEARNHAVIEIARRLRWPLVATNGVCYAQPHEREILDVLTCVRHHTQLDSAGRLLARNGQRYLKPAPEMVRLFADIPEAIASTLEVSSRLNFTLADLGYEFPRYPVPEGETMMSFLRARTTEGARQRYRPLDSARHARARRQIERELALIEKLDLAGYFLIVWDLVRFARENGILVQGRGSAANSAVCYSLGITAVDPVGMDLLFERFLSEERGEWPDIDLDLPSGDQRERVIQYVYERYGRRGAAMTANVITYRGRSAAREVGKALGFDEPTTARVARLAAAFEWKDPKDTPERQFREAGLDIEAPRIRKFLQLYGAVQDLPRHLGQHSGGMVICQGHLDEVVPLEPASMPGRVVVQWDKDDCADLGIIKVDLLGLGMMAVLEESLQLIRNDYGDEVDLAHLPPNDPVIYKTLQKADTVGLFQVESRAQMSCLPRLRPVCFYDIVVQVAIIRPGPIVGNMVNPYLKRRQGREAVDYMHPSLEPVLARTLGVPLFQEQLLRMAMVAAGFTGGEAEELRRAFGFKRSERRMAEVELKLRAGMDRKGIAGEVQDRIIHSITSFALYGFPESHSASFALIAYASAFLKCHYLAAFVAALLNNQPMGFYHPSTIIKDAQRHGLRFKPAEVTRSEWACTIEEDEKQAVGREPSAAADQPPAISEQVDVYDTRGKCVRLGLRYVRGLREEAARAIVRERGRRPFASIDDLARRVPELHRDELKRLAEAGALNYIGGENCGLRIADRGFQAPETEVASDEWRVASGQEGARFEVRGASEKEPEIIADSHPAASLAPRPSPLAPSSQSRHRRDALWDAERAARTPGPLLEQIPDPNAASPLAMMDAEERMHADFRATGVTIGRHPIALRRDELNALGVTRAADLSYLRNGRKVRVAGIVICRQRPGTAKGFVFLSLEDETGIANVIVTPDQFNANRLALTGEPMLVIDGALQNLDNVISVKAGVIRSLPLRGALPPSHDFH